MKYKVGDKVRVREDLAERQGTTNYWINKTMIELAGKTVTITHVFDNCYSIDKDLSTFNWEDAMLEPEDGVKKLLKHAACENCLYWYLASAEEPCKFCCDNSLWKSNKINDVVNHPAHYTSGKYEVIDYIEDKLTAEQFEGACIFNVLKYTSRYREKDGLQDLKKARYYLDRIIKKMGEQG